MMKKGVKIFMGVGCGLLLIGAIVVVIVGIFALKYYDKRMDATFGPIEAEGREFGKTTDKQGCMDEGLKRSTRVGLVDFSAALAISAFVDSCFEPSRATLNFCDGVPSFWSLKDSEWGAAQCRKAGIDPEKSGCIHVFKRKHQFCSKPF